jgi:putative SOS response-associated peptidase YedK
MLSASLQPAGDAISPSLIYHPRKTSSPQVKMSMMVRTVQRHPEDAPMCGRFVLFASGDELAERFQLPEAPLLDARYNVSPTQTIATVRLAPTGRELARLKWGFQVGSNLWLNARGETVASKPLFRNAFPKRRCLILASGWYEWQRIGREKYPHFIRPRDGGLLAFAGLWDRDEATIITTEANDTLKYLHERMPVIVDPASDAVWLDPTTPTDALQALLIPYPDERMEAIAVSSWVSNSRNEGERCLQPA